MVEVSTSFLNIKKDDIIKTIYNLEVAGTNYFHVDVMDGKFVKNNTVAEMKEYSEYIKSVSNLPLDIHLMVEDVDSFVKSYLALEPNSISIHYESCRSEKEMMKYIKLIKESNSKVGICISPKTSIEEIYKYLPYIHRVVIMTVEPGKGGQELIPETIGKISKLNAFIYENGYEVDIEADGGINDKTAKEVKYAGANILASGNYIITSNNYIEAIRKLRKD